MNKKIMFTMTFTALFVYAVECNHNNKNIDIKSFKDVINNIKKEVTDDIKKTDQIYQQLRLSSIDKFSKEELSQIAKVSLSKELLELKKLNPDSCVTCIHTEDPNTWYQ